MDDVLKPPPPGSLLATDRSKVSPLIGRSFWPDFLGKSLRPLAVYASGRYV